MSEGRIEALRADIARWHTALLRPGSGRHVRLASPAVDPVSGMIVVAAQSCQRLDLPPLWTLCRVDPGAGRLVPLCGRSGDQIEPRFAPGGGWLLFRCGTEAGYGACVLDLPSGEASALPQPDGSVEQALWMPDGTRVLLLVADPGASLASVQGATAGARPRGHRPSWYPHVDDGSDPPRRRILLTSHAAASCEEIATLANPWEICAVGNAAVAAIATDDPSEDAWYRADLRLIDLAGGAERLLYRPRHQLAHLSSNPAGTHLAFVEGLASDRGHLAGDLVVVEVAGGTVTRIDIRGVDIGWTGWRGDELVAAGICRNDMALLSVDIAARTAAIVCMLPELNGGTRYPLPALLPGAVPKAAIVLHGIGRMDRLAIIGDDPTETILSLDTPESAAAITAYGPERFRPVEWRASDGEIIDGWLHVPAGKGPFPLVMLIHGGPVMRWTPRSLLDNAIQAAFAARGWAQFLPNPRGSTGRGQTYAQAILHDMGGRDALDLLEGMDMLVAEGIADPERLAVTGISHGGFMSAWLVTQDNRFKAAAAVAPITDWTSQRLTSDIPSFNDDFVGDPPGGAPSPIRYAANVTAEMLVIGGARDRCTPPAQAEEFHRALRLAGKHSTLLIYPEEGHGIRANTAAAIDHLARITAFFERHL